MTNFPRTREALEFGGYSFERRTRCKGCGATIEFWRTPFGKWLPMNVVENTNELQPHWESCPKADQFRKPVATKQVEKQEVKREEPKQKELF